MGQLVVHEKKIASNVQYDKIAMTVASIALRNATVVDI